MKKIMLCCVIYIGIFEGCVVAAPNSSPSYWMKSLQNEKNVSITKNGVSFGKILSDDRIRTFYESNQGIKMFGDTLIPNWHDRSLVAPIYSVDKTRIAGWLYFNDENDYIHIYDINFVQRFLLDGTSGNVSNALFTEGNDECVVVYNSIAEESIVIVTGNDASTSLYGWKNGAISPRGIWIDQYQIFFYVNEEGIVSVSRDGVQRSTVLADPNDKLYSFELVNDKLYVLQDCDNHNGVVSTSLDYYKIVDGESDYESEILCIDDEMKIARFDQWILASTLSGELWLLDGSTAKIYEISAIDEYDQMRSSLFLDQVSQIGDNRYSVTIGHVLDGELTRIAQEIESE